MITYECDPAVEKSLELIDRLEELLLKHMPDYSPSVYDRDVYCGDTRVWHVTVDARNGAVPIGSVGEQTGVAYIYHLLLEEFGPALGDISMRVQKDPKVEGFTDTTAFEFQTKVKGLWAFLPLRRRSQVG